MAGILLLMHEMHAQEVQESSRNKVQFKLGAFYNSHLNYYGRTDSLRSSGFFPLAELWFSENFYVNAAPVFTSSVIDRFDYAGTVATAGYQARSRNQKFFTHVYFTKPFYEPGTQLVQSSLKAQLGSSVSWQNRILNLNVAGDLKLSGRLDYGLSTGVDRIFKSRVGEKAVLVINPSVYAHAGTQQFTKYVREKNDFILIPGQERTVEKDASRLAILSYEISSPIILARENWQFIAIPAYVIPKNLLSVEGRPDLTERGKQLFYVTVGLKHTF